MESPGIAALSKFGAQPRAEENTLTIETKLGVSTVEYSLTWLFSSYRFLHDIGVRPMGPIVERYLLAAKLGRTVGRRKNSKREKCNTHLHSNDET